MARPIRMTRDIQEACLQDFMKALSDARMTGAGFKYEKKFSYEGKKKATVLYTKEAWYKTIMLIETQPKEVGWHGICHRDESDPTTFIVSDILVYPQAVTGATINPDPVEYTNWMNGLDDDTFNHLRFHGHSHVYMQTSPSSVDMTFRSDRLSQLQEDEFYVFQIMNKRGEISSEVYDLANNILYDTGDVDTLVDCDDMKIWDTYKNIGKILQTCKVEEIQPAIDVYMSSGMNEFISGVSNLVKEEKPKYQTVYNSGAYRGTSYSGYPYWTGTHNKYYASDQGGGNFTTASDGKLVPINVGSAEQKESDDGDELRGFQNSTLYDGEFNRMLSDPLGYTDERGQFHGSDGYWMD